MKTIWEKIKTYTTLIVGGIIAGALIVLRINAIKDAELDAEASELQSEEDAIDAEIDALEDDLDNIEVEDLSDEEISDYWDNMT